MEGGDGGAGYGQRGPAVTSHGHCGSSSIPGVKPRSHLGYYSIITITLFLLLYSCFLRSLPAWSRVKKWGRRKGGGEGSEESSFLGAGTVAGAEHACGTAAPSCRFSPNSGSILT